MEEDEEVELLMQGSVTGLYKQRMVALFKEETGFLADQCRILEDLLWPLVTKRIFNPSVECVNFEPLQQFI